MFKKRNVEEMFCWRLHMGAAIWIDQTGQQKDAEINLKRT